MASNEVSNNLDKFVDSELDNYLKTALTKACAIVRNEAIKKAPQRTGALKRSIDFEVSDDGQEGVIFSNLEYAPFVELGTGEHATRGNGRDTPWTYPAYLTNAVAKDMGITLKKDSKGRTIHTQFFTTTGMKPRPFLEPALTENTLLIRDCFEGLF